MDICTGLAAYRGGEYEDWEEFAMHRWDRGIRGVSVHPWVGSRVRIAGDAKGYYIAISSTHLLTVDGGMSVWKNVMTSSLGQGIGSNPGEQVSSEHRTAINTSESPTANGKKYSEIRSLSNC